MLCPLHIHNWKNIDTKTDMWNYTREKYDIPDAAEKWILKEIQGSWRRYKNSLYNNHFKCYGSDEHLITKKPQDVSETDFKDLLIYWKSDELK
ncbi:hypothetical protein HAX54_043130 [Datura stramonium]|uniref:Uncharacterized protein n=1 Tax=Datura stramonium TaxID=4076 RepID=A0ABS8W0V8_DATST|nr:hypothetical protein [Datura stramonium]